MEVFDFGIWDGGLEVFDCGEGLIFASCCEEYSLGVMLRELEDAFLAETDVACGVLSSDSDKYMGGSQTSCDQDNFAIEIWDISLWLEVDGTSAQEAVEHFD
jgi:hypothetical protein